ncbi:TetR/AcrR family transcriptional regulator [Thermomonas sp. HDW16]|uniref:TetR/AcrR family transcriptional regulator n=1 Tax=Thermomonas sp. HDW16 TaxID=2714945 RepID=UPI00140B325B|nr:TetR/AcrR family transcriptional regulator [Thermomonas sp. HDW16]QIL19537.1 TetR/AcrR family transcriptional regulator [Thermomonas sp. HDW16]
MSPSTTESRREARTKAQRNRILDAAQKCFTERGFHGASMAMIAETAQMSAGLIYRYFAGKSELIHGIVSRQIELMADDLQVFQSGARDAASFIVERFREDADSAGKEGGAARMLEPALILEIVAESGRDPVIASAFDALDRHVDVALGAWLARPREQGGLGVPAAQLPARVLVLRSVFDGLKMRQARHPKMDLELLHEALTVALRGLHVEP